MKGPRYKALAHGVVHCHLKIDCDMLNMYTKNPKATTEKLQLVIQ